MANKVSWSFPSKNTLFLKIEMFVVACLAALVFTFSYLSTANWGGSLFAAVVFLVVYLAASLLITELRQVEEKYLLTPTHLEISRKSRNTKVKHKVHVKHIAMHKLDHRWFGGYVVTKKGKRHPLFFNNKKEVEKFEKFLLRHKSRKKKSEGKNKSKSSKKRNS